MEYYYKKYLKYKKKYIQLKNNTVGGIGNYNFFRIMSEKKSLDLDKVLSMDTYKQKYIKSKDKYLDSIHIQTGNGVCLKKLYDQHSGQCWQDVIVVAVTQIADESQDFLQSSSIEFIDTIKRRYDFLVDPKHNSIHKFMSNLINLTPSEKVYVVKYFTRLRNRFIFKYYENIIREYGLDDIFNEYCLTHNRTDDVNALDIIPFPEHIKTHFTQHSDLFESFISDFRMKNDTPDMYGSQSVVCAHFSKVLANVNRKRVDTKHHNVFFGGENSQILYTIMLCSYFLFNNGYLVNEVYIKRNHYAMSNTILYIDDIYKKDFDALIVTLDSLAYNSGHVVLIYKCIDKFYIYDNEVGISKEFDIVSFKTNLQIMKIAIYNELSFEYTDYRSIVDLRYSVTEILSITYVQTQSSQHNNILSIDSYKAEIQKHIELINSHNINILQTFGYYNYVTHISFSEFNIFSEYLNFSENLDVIEFLLTYVLVHTIPYHTEPMSKCKRELAPIFALKYPDEKNIVFAIQLFNIRSNIFEILIKFNN